MNDNSKYRITESGLHLLGIFLARLQLTHPRLPLFYNYG